MNEDYIIDKGVLEKYDGAGGDVVIPDSVTTIGDYVFVVCPLATIRGRLAASPRNMRRKTTFLLSPSTDIPQPNKNENASK